MYAVKRLFLQSSSAEILAAMVNVLDAALAPNIEEHATELRQ
jgi:hypothetical protein